MLSHVIVYHGETETDITPYIVANSYDMNIEQEYLSWKDGNMNEHRIVTTEKVKGSFDVACSNKRNSIQLFNFLNMWNEAATNYVITLSVYVPSLGVRKLIYAYYEIKQKDHALTADDSFIDVLHIEIKEM